MNLKDYFNRDNIKNFIEGKWNKFKNYSSFLKLEVHLREQAIYRAILCKECYDNGTCLLCGCQTPDMFYAPAKECPDNKWGIMSSADAWEQFKEEKGINADELIMLESTDFAALMKDDLEGLPEWLKRQIYEKDEKERLKQEWLNKQ